jgi:hypothetical protein
MNERMYLNFCSNPECPGTTEDFEVSCSGCLKKFDEDFIFTPFDPETGQAVDDSTDLLVDRLEHAQSDMMDPLIRHYLAAAKARIEYLERQ